MPAGVIKCEDVQLFGKIEGESPGKSLLVEVPTKAHGTKTRADLKRQATRPHNIRSPKKDIMSAQALLGHIQKEDVSKEQLQNCLAILADVFNNKEKSKQFQAHYTNIKLNPQINKKPTSHISRQQT